MTADDSESYTFSWAEMTTVPQDAIRIDTASVRVMLGPSADSKIDVGLLVDLPPPIGSVRITLTPDQISAVHDRLHSLLSLNAQQVQELVHLVNHPPTD